MSSARRKKSEILHGINSQNLIVAYAAAQSWLRRKNVTAIGIGYAWKDDRPTDEISLSVHVSKRIPTENLSRRQLLPRALQGVRVDVMESNLEVHLSEEEVLARRGSAANPLQPGVLIKTAYGDVGTAALLVRGKQSEDTFILGSGHVMLKQDAVLFQPSKTAPGHLIGRVARVERSRGDAGIATYTGRQIENRPYGSSVVINSTREVQLNDVLEMSGAFSGRVLGVVDWIGSRNIKYPDGKTIEVPGFQLRPYPLGSDYILTQQGDSGALWFDQLGNAVGINIGGSKFAVNGEGEALRAPWAFASHIVDMMEALDVEI